MHKLAAFILILLALSACGSQTAATSVMPSPSALATELTPAAGVFLPYIERGCPCPCPTDTPTPEPTPTPGPVAIYDCDGQITSTLWLTTTFGAVTWSEGNLLELRCSIGPSVLVAHVIDITGQPVENATVVLYWPDAPFLPPELQRCGVDRGVYGPTNANGDIGFGLGPGSYYFPPEGGPHLMFVAGGASCLSGLGMLGGTNHAHLDSAWTVDGKAVDADRGYSRGAVVYQQEVDGRRMWVIQLP